MQRSNNDSGLTVQRSNRLLAVGLIAIGLCGCASTQLPPLDDAYYWPSDESSASSVSSVSSPSSSPAHTIEYLNVQDTTVTIRIKK